MNKLYIINYKLQKMAELDNYQLNDYTFTLGFISLTSVL
jgi:hypothetical protein